MNLIERAEKYQESMAARVVAAKINNVIVDLNYNPKDSDIIELIDISSIEGIRVYRNTLKYILIKAIDDIYDNCKIKINYSMNKGGYCELIDKKTSDDDIIKIKERMQQLIHLKLPIVKNQYTIETAKKILKKSGREARVKMLNMIENDEVTLYNLSGSYDYFYGVLTPDTGYIDVFDIKKFKDGFLLLFPNRFEPTKLPEFKSQESLWSIFEEYKEWGNILGIDSISDINDIVKSGKISDLILIAEALQEKKLAYIADNVNRLKKQFIFIAGPSSSGKTTFANRLLIQLRANGLKGTIISLDSYYKGVGKVPYDVDGKLNYEAIEALDLDLLEKNLKQLIKENKTNIPIYDFKTETVIGYNSVKMDDRSIVIFEGIHGLNPLLYKNIDSKLVYKIYISALTSINIDSHNRLPATDTRLIRRIVRDYKYRGAKASKTIKMWASVRKGEDKSIFPYQDSANEAFNSSLIYEHGVLKKYALEVLRKVNKEDKAYAEAQRLIELLMYFKDINEDSISITSLLREFIGKSVFR